MNFRKWSGFLFPNNFSIGVMIISLAVFMLTILVSLCVGVSDVANFFKQGVFVLCCSSPLLIMALGVGSLMEHHAAPRALLSAGTMLATLYTFFLAIPYTIANPTKDSSVGSTIMGLGCLLIPALFLVSLPLLFSIPRLPEEYRAYIDGLRTTDLKDYLTAHNGILLYSEAARSLSINEQNVDRSVRHFMDIGDWVGERNLEAKCFISHNASVMGQKSILKMIGSRGEMKIDEMGKEMGIPEVVIRDWLMQLIKTQQFPGYVNWETGIVYPPEASAIQKDDQCPTCGGELILAGKDVVQCRNCGNLLFG